MNNNKTKTSKYNHRTLIDLGINNINHNINFKYNHNSKL